MFECESTTLHLKRGGSEMQPHIARKSHKRHITTFAALGLTTVAAATSLAAPAQAAANVVITLRCDGPHDTYSVGATLSGSGAPTAKYNVAIWTYDKFDDTRAPMVRLSSVNQDNSNTHYPWRTGDQGHALQSSWYTTLQQPKGLKFIFIEAKVNTSDWASYQCSDYAPK
jgi:hypothetical protein